jgi:hypothetical protein
MTWDGSDRREGQRWRLKREISIGDVIAFVTACIAVVVAYSTLDKRLTRIEDSSVIQKETDRRQDDEQLRAIGRIEQSMRDINDKLDRIREQQRSFGGGSRFDK